ncbi:MAG: hypothetical protein ACREQH_02915, partial [Candidatus Binatus sp.]
LTATGTFVNSNVDDVPVGVGIAVNTGAEYLFTANQGMPAGLSGSVSSFVIFNITTPITPPTTTTAYNGPTGLVVDPQNQFVYTANNFDGTVAQSVINGKCGSSICAGPTTATESPHNPGSGPFGITLAQ